MSSTGDEFCGPCGHPREDHDRDGCRTCPGDDERSWRHPYQPEATPHQIQRVTELIDATVPGAAESAPAQQSGNCTVCGHIPERHYGGTGGQAYCAQCPADGRWHTLNGAASATNPDPARYGRRVDELPPGVTGVVTVAERIVNPAALTPQPLYRNTRVYPIDLDNVLTALDDATGAQDDPDRVTDLDDQLTAVIAGLLSLATDPAGVTSRALLVYPDNRVTREGALKRLVDWRTQTKISALDTLTETTTTYKAVLTGGTPEQAEDAESLLSAVQNRYQVANTALAAATDALAEHQDRKDR
jgi:hypothetical protein